MAAQKIVPCLWFDHQAEEAAKFYTGLFKRSKMGMITRYGEGAPMPKGSILTVSFILEGQELMALNGGPQYKMTPAISLFVRVDTQKEVDRLYDTLVIGGEELACGWVTDRYGVTWQIVPATLLKYVFDKDPVKAKRAMAAMMRMRKLDLETIKRAHAGKV